MKKKILVFLSALMSLLSFGQQRPHYTQYVLNNYILNPALAGIENYTDLKISSRDQWVGLNGAPQTSYFSIHSPIGKKDYKTTATSFAVPGENPRGTSYWENYTASASHYGAGLTLINDKTGLYNRFSVAGSFAYHLGLSPRTNLSAGFSGGITNFSFNAAKAQAADPNDPALAAGGTMNRLRPDLGAGLWLYSADFFIGLSAQQVIPQKVNFVDDDRYGFRTVPHFFATAGYRFLLTEDINALPSVMLKAVSGSPTHPQFDLNVKLQYQDLLWLGGSYRLTDGYAAMIGLNISNTFHVGYAYDFTRTSINTASRGTHELILGFLIGNTYGDTCPRNVW
jgi:type IX secretion system PorP/SprF family membrane protein